MGARLFIGFGLAIAALVAILFVFDGVAIARELDERLSLADQAEILTAAT